MKALLQKILKRAANYRGSDTSSVDKSVLSLMDAQRLRSIAGLLNTLNCESIEGDIVEAGVWRGGAAIVEGHYSNGRTIWCCDTFAGFPPGSEPHVTGNLSVSLEEVKQNIKLHGIGNYQFLVGDFKDTLPGPIGDIALLHFDGDSPYAIRCVLDTLYEKVVDRGYIVIDDYCLPDCRKALHAWLSEHSLAPRLMNPYTEQELRVGETPCGLWWRK